MYRCGVHGILRLELPPKVGAIANGGKSEDAQGDIEGALWVVINLFRFKHLARSDTLRILTGGRYYIRLELRSGSGRPRRGDDWLRF